MFFSARPKSLFTALLLVAALPVQLLHAANADQARIEKALNGLNRGHSIGALAVSPDGKRLAWASLASGGGEILVAPLDNLAKAERVTAASAPAQHCREGQFVWAPNSQAIAFFSDCARPAEQADLYIAPLDGGATRRLTELNGYVDDPAFSPDGSRIAFLYVEGATRPAGALAAMQMPSGVIGEDGIEIQRLAYASTDAVKPAAPAIGSPANLHVYEFNWAPNSKSLAYIAADPPGENNWWVAKLYTQKIDGKPKAILDPPQIAGALHGMQIAVPRWSPDGNSIAFIGGLMSDQGSTGGDLWIVPSAGGDPVNLTPGRLSSPAWLEWKDDTHVDVTELAGGNSRLVRFRLDSARSSASEESIAFSIPASVGDGRFDLSLSATADHSTYVFNASAFDTPAEVYASHFGQPAGQSASAFPGLTQLTHFNDGVQPGWGKTVSLAWTSDSFHVQGWLLLPKDYNPAKKYPLVVEVHGGPAAAVQSSWGARGAISPAAFSAMGYFVLQPNPRGSYGQGEAFAQANRKDFGYGDLRDILAGVDTALAQYSIDPARVGLTGWSYGGFMTMFAVTQTHRFKAAVAGAGISDWLSYYGENSIDQWMIPYFGASVYDDPAVYAKSSAINYIKSADTPTLVVVGDRDGECPAPQSFEFWHALRDRHVPTQLVVYPNEGHGFVDPTHRRDVIERAVEWFNRYMPPAS